MSECHTLTSAGHVLVWGSPNGQCPSSPAVCQNRPVTDWEERIKMFLSEVSSADQEFTLDSMQALIAERRDDDPAAIFGWASVHDDERKVLLW